MEGDVRRAGLKYVAVPISIHALRVEGDLRAGYGSANLYPISIHALRVEGDVYLDENVTGNLISIHALRVEGDKRQQGFNPNETHFYPRPPGGGRRMITTKHTPP